MTVIKIPSKNIYEKNNQKVIDNIIDKVEVSSKEVIPKNEYDTNIYNNDLGTLGYYADIPNEGFNEEYRLHTQAPTTYLAVYGKIEPYYLNVHIEIPRKRMTSTVVSIKGGVDEQGEANIKYNTECTKKTAPITATYNPQAASTDNLEPFTDISYSYPQMGETNIYQIPTKLELSESNSEFTVTKEVVLNDKTNLKEVGNAVPITESSNTYSFDCVLLCGAEILEIKGSAVGSPASASGTISSIAQGTATEYIPQKVSITVYGNTVGIDLKDKVITIGNSKNLMSFSGNELVQTTNSPSIETQYQSTINEWQNGKETATLTCDIADYYDADGNLAISANGNDTLPMTFHLGDIIVPYVYGANGEDKPMSTYADGTPKVFTVIGKHPSKTGAVWQEITLQEKTN